MKAYMTAHDKENAIVLEDFNIQITDSHRAGIYKGLMCLLGMYLFFLIEKLVQMRQVKRKPVKHNDEVV